LPFVCQIQDSKYSQIAQSIARYPALLYSVHPYPLPTWPLKENIAYVATFITRLFNQLLATGQVPATFKSAYDVPRLKKLDLDTDVIKNYWPISILPVLAKRLERIVAKQLVAYLNLHG